MMLAALRSMIFALLFYPLTALACVLLLPTLVLPRRFFLAVVQGFVRVTALLERSILGLSYEVRGLENLPPQGPYLIAAKHQSAYETTKLHLLFPDPAIVLKKELLRIPLWGLYLAKSDVIAIDRSTPKMAVQSIQEGAKRMAAQGRPIVIFPQGTRVSTTTTITDRPYKIGIIRLQEATNLPIIPLALNTGYFWPRNSFFKKPGRVIFEFLKPIPPGGDASATLAHLQTIIEDRSQALLAEAQSAAAIKRPLNVPVLLWALLIGFCALWSAYWLVAANLTRQSLQNTLRDMRADTAFAGSRLVMPEISGFPFQMEINAPELTIVHEGVTFTLANIHAKGWPIPGARVRLSIAPLSVQQENWTAPLRYDSFLSVFRYARPNLTIENAQLIKDNARSTLQGTITFNEPYPALDLTLGLENHAAILENLIAIGAVPERSGLIAGAALGALQKGNDTIALKITTQDRDIYLGPFKIFTLPEAAAKQTLSNGSSSAIATQRKKWEIKP